MKTIQLSERELFMIFNMLTPPYAVSDTHTDEFNELRNKVFYALCDAQNDEHVSNRDELPDIVGWIRSDYHSDRRMGDAPIFILGCIDPSDVWGVKYIPLSGNSPVIPDSWIPVGERMPDRDAEVLVYCADTKEQMVGYMERNGTEGWFRFASLPNGGGIYCNPTHWMPLPAAPTQVI